MNVCFLSIEQIIIWFDAHFFFPCYFINFGFSGHRSYYTENGQLKQFHGRSNQRDKAS